MDPLATKAELAAVPGVDLTGVDDATQDMALQLATSAIIAELGWDPREQERTLRLRPTQCAAPVFLPAMNVTAVEVTLDGLVVDPLDWTTPDSVIYLGYGFSTSGTVVYTAGWPAGSIPGGLRDACLQRAANLIDNPARLQSWQAGDARESYDFVGLREDDPRLAAYRILVIA